MDYYEENYLGNMILEESLGELDKQDYKIVLLYYWQGYPDADIGRILNESQQKINYRRNRALKKLKSFFGAKTSLRFGGRREQSGRL